METLGDRMKSYENETRLYLPKKSYTICRVDGKAFHTFTKNANKPFDNDVIVAMANAGLELCKSIQGAEFAYIQSDEISILYTDFQNQKSEAWFGSNIQKQASVTASMATYFFNRNINWMSDKFPQPAFFDSRVFTLPSKDEVENYFIWRFLDWKRNSVFMLARSLFSHRDLMNKNQEEVKQMLIEQQGRSWDGLIPILKYGTFIFKKKRRVSSVVGEIDREAFEIDYDGHDILLDRELLRNRIPELSNEI